MIDWSLVEGFDWDDGNRRKNLDKHAVEQGEAEQVFFGEPLLVVPDGRHSLEAEEDSAVLFTVVKTDRQAQPSA